MEQNYWEAEDKKYIWHPAMQMKDNEVFPPVVIDHAKGSYLYGMDGKEYLDIISSWWCNLLGHCNEEINEALKKQVDELEHVIFTNFSHKPAVKLAQELEKVLPEGLSRFTFHDNGSSCVEAALKMAFQYHYQTGHPERTRFMCLPESYHGETIGALSVGRWTFMRRYSILCLWTIFILTVWTAIAALMEKRGIIAAWNALKVRKTHLNSTEKKRRQSLWSRSFRERQACVSILPNI